MIVITIIRKHIFTISSMTSLSLSRLAGKQSFVKSVSLSSEPDIVLVSTDVTMISKMIDNSLYHIPPQFCSDGSVINDSYCFVFLICLLKSK